MVNNSRMITTVTTRQVSSATVVLPTTSPQRPSSVCRGGVERRDLRWGTPTGPMGGRLLVAPSSRRAIPFLLGAPPRPGTGHRANEYLAVPVRTRASTPVRSPRGPSFTLVEGEARGPVTASVTRVGRLPRSKDTEPSSKTRRADPDAGVQTGCNPTGDSDCEDPSTGPGPGPGPR